MRCGASDVDISILIAKFTDQSNQWPIMIGSTVDLPKQRERERERDLYL
jgi:hypothetical protein